MDRRNTIKTLMAATGGLIALPSWAEGWTRNDVTDHVSVFTTDEQGLLTAVADTIIPVGRDGIGAVSTGTDKYLDRLISDCYEQDVQDNVKTQLAELESQAQSGFHTSYAACSQAQREKLLNAFENASDDNQKEFFKFIKGETIRGFTTCEEVMTKYFDYKVAPGHYYGCVDVNE